MRRDHHHRARIAVAEKLDRGAVHFGVGLVVPHEVGAEHRVPRQAAMLRHIGQQAHGAVRQRRDDVFLLDPGQAGYRIGPRSEPVPGQVQPLLVGLVETAHAEFFEQLVERHPVQRVEIGPGQFAGAHLVHRRRIKAAPLVGELLPIDPGDALARGEGFPVRGHGAAPIDHRPENIVYQGLHFGHSSLRRRIAPQFEFCIIISGRGRSPRTRNSSIQASECLGKLSVHGIRSRPSGHPGTTGAAQVAGSGLYRPAQCFERTNRMSSSEASI